MIESTDLTPDLGTLDVTTKMTLAHNTDKSFKGRPRVSTNPDRLIPRSFSLGRNVATDWGYFGQKRLLFNVKPGSKVLTIDRKQFFNWGPERATPLQRGVEIEKWGRENGVDIVKLKLAPIQDLEFAVLNTDILEPIEHQG